MSEAAAEGLLRDDVPPVATGDAGRGALALSVSVALAIAIPNDAAGIAAAAAGVSGIVAAARGWLVERELAEGGGGASTDPGGRPVV